MLTNNDLFPEHEALVTELVSLRERGRLPHAILVTSDSGLGLENVVRTLVRNLLGAHPSRDAIVADTAERRFEAGTHGDFRWVEILEGKASIGVDQIREACDFMAKTAGYGALKVLVIKEADKLTLGAANALLKTLEEPQGDSVIFLMSQRFWLLPATIRSRCQSWTVPTLSATTSRAFLAETASASHELESTPPRLLERLVMTQMAGKEGIRGDIAVALEGVLDGRLGAEVLVQALIKFEFADSLEELVRAIEEKALTSEHARVSLMSLLGLHRVAATLLQRVRFGAVPAREGACYELGMLAQRAGNNALDEVLDDLALMGT